MTRTICLLFIMLWGVQTAHALEKPLVIEGLSRPEALRLGEQMYRKGILPSGKPMEAIVQGDIPMDGTMFTCVSCHLRSGLGSTEGTIITLPTNGADLFRTYAKGSEMIRPLQERFADVFQKEDLRPAYNEETLARALQSGLDSAGRQLDFIMPRYTLSERDMDILVFYLKNLSMEFSPGVTDTTIRFATVITEDVGREDRQAMLKIVEAHVRDKNTQTRQQVKRAKQGPFFRLEVNTAYRKLELSIWDLKGEPATWQAQLDEYYSNDPVFALLGGISTKDWQPIHEFCEHHKIPCLFPITNFPVISKNDWHTLYFSKGFYQEGETVARYLREIEITDDTQIIQVFRTGHAGHVMAKAFQESWEKFGRMAPTNMSIRPQEKITKNFWGRLANNKTVVLLWLPFEDLASFEELALSARRPERVFTSSSLLGDGVYQLPEKNRRFTFITYPYSLPENEKKKKFATENWLRIRNIPVTDIKTQDKMYFLGWVLTGALMDMRRDYYRDRFLEGIDMMTDMGYAIAVYPNVSFGVGQRYASKGCYIVQLAEGPNPQLEKRSNWITH